MKKRLVIIAVCGLLLAVMVAALGNSGATRRTPAGQPPLASLRQNADAEKFWADFDAASDQVRAVIFLSPT